MKLRFCCAIKDSQLLFIELIIRTHIEKHSIGLSPLNFLFLARSPNEKWFAIEITRKYEKLSQRAYNEFKTTECGRSAAARQNGVLHGRSGNGCTWRTTSFVLAYTVL